MSNSESEPFNDAIVVGKNVSSPSVASKGSTDGDTEKMCSACRHHKAIKEFVGLTPRNEGQEMRTCTDCRTRNRKPPMETFKESLRSVRKRILDDNKSGRSGRATRRKTISNTNSPTRAAAMSQLTSARATTAAATATATATAAAQARQDSPPATRRSRVSISRAHASSPPLPSNKNTDPEATHDDNTDNEEEFSSPARTAPSPKCLKRRSTPPPHEDSNEEAIQVRQHPPKRQRAAAPPTSRRQADVEQEVGLDGEVEDDGAALNANGHPVGSDLAAFANSLGRLSQLLINAGKNLDSERIGALESEIHHDWRVDEMATFVEGFLKGASANAAGKGW